VTHTFIININTYIFTSTATLTIAYFSADPLSHAKDTPASLRISPVKVVFTTPNKGQLLDRKTLARPPIVCPWCLVWLVRSLREHLFTGIHKNHIHMPRLLALKDNEELLQKELTRLTLLGRRRNNELAFKNEDRPIIPKYRSDGNNTNKVICQFCYMSVSRRVYNGHHGALCAEKTGKTKTLTEKDCNLLLKAQEPLFRTENEEMELLLADKSPMFREILFHMTKDRLELSRFCIENNLASQIIRNHCRDKEGSSTKISRTRSILRMLYGMVKTFRHYTKNDTLTIEEILCYETWHAMTQNPEVPDIISCCFDLCGKKEGTGEFRSELDVMNFSSMLRRISHVQEHSVHYPDAAVRATEQSKAKALRDFIDSDIWKVDTVRQAAKQKAKKHSFDKTILRPEDMKCYIATTEDVARKAYKRLVEFKEADDIEGCKRAVHDLSEALGIAIGAFSCRRLQEPYFMTLEDFKKKPNLEVLCKTQPEEVQLSSQDSILEFFIMASAGKSGQVLTIIKTEWLPAMETLCDPEFRAKLGVDPSNQTIFFTPRDIKNGYPNASRAQKKFAKMCEGKVENVNILRSINLRASFSTFIAQLDVTYTVKKHICAILGHTLEVHDRFYEIPQYLDAVRIMGFALKANATNTIQNYKAKKIEDLLKINLQPPAPDEVVDSGYLIYIFIYIQ
jgi:hypothetical protein